MAFETQVSKEFKKYMGVGRVKVVAVNPSLKQLNDLGIQFKEEPVYLKDDAEGIKQINFNFWTKATVNGAEVVTPIKLSVKNKVSVSSAGKTEYINAKGENQWTESAPTKTDYFDPIGCRKAFVGETALIGFIKNWLNVRKGGNANLSLEPMFKGNFAELKDLTSNNDIYVLYMVADEKYQNVYSRYFVRGFVSEGDAQEQFKRFIQKQTDSGYEPKEDYTIELQEWSGVSPDSEMTPAPIKEDDPSNTLPF